MAEKDCSIFRRELMSEGEIDSGLRVRQASFLRQGEVSFAREKHPASISFP
jgi:hypothetical protein